MVVVLAGFAGTVNAAGIRYAQVTGTASGTGQITVETFSKPDFPGRVSPKSAASCAPCGVVVPVPNGFTAAQTANAIADSCAAVLASENYTSMVVAGHPTIVAICYNGAGPFTSMNITESIPIPGQSTVEIPASAVPTLTEWGLITLAVLVSGLGIYMMRRPRPAGPTA